MIIGITGASGSGKTTLATEVADSLGLKFVPSEVNKIAKAAGFPHASVSITLEERLALQQKILLGFAKFLAELQPNTITDRTPLDIAAYMMAEVTMHSDKAASDHSLQQIAKFVDDCVSLTNSRFDTIFVVRPLDKYEAIEGKRPAANPAYHLHTQLIMEGVAARARRVNQMVTLITSDHDQRVHIATETILDRIDRIESMVKENRIYN